MENGEEKEYSFDRDPQTFPGYQQPEEVKQPPIQLGAYSQIHFLNLVPLVVIQDEGNSADGHRVQWNRNREQEFRPDQDVAVRDEENVIEHRDVQCKQCRVLADKGKPLQVAKQMKYSQDQQVQKDCE